MKKEERYCIILFLILLFLVSFPLKKNDNVLKKETNSEEKTDIVLKEDVATISEPIIDLQITLTPNIIDYKKEYSDKVNGLSNYGTIDWFKQYKDLQVEYSSNIDVDTTIYDVFSTTQISYMERCIETEVYQAPFDSKCNVASVILNRVYGSSWSNDSIVIITSKNQFAYFRKDITESTILALEYAYQIGDTTNGCVAFRSGNKPNSWIGLNLQFIDEVGHGFYK